MALVAWGKENIWFRNLLDELVMIRVIEPTLCTRPIHILEDNSSVIAMSKGQQTALTRHYRLSWYLLKQMIKLGDYVLIKIDTHENPADLFTKALGNPKFSYFRDMLMGGDDLQKHFKKAEIASSRDSKIKAKKTKSTINVMETKIAKTTPMMRRRTTDSKARVSEDRSVTEESMQRLAKTTD